MNCVSVDRNQRCPVLRSEPSLECFVGDQLIDLLGLTTGELEEIFFGHSEGHAQHGHGKRALPGAGQM